MIRRVIIQYNADMHMFWIENVQKIVRTPIFYTKF